MEASIHFSKWLSYILCQTSTTKHHNNFIQTIWVESAYLTASYYREYLGFSIVLRNPLKRNSQVLIKNGYNWVLIRPFDSNKPVYSQRINLYSHRVDLDYEQLYNKVRVIKPFHLDSNQNLVVEDCNGIEIVYNSN